MASLLRNERLSPLELRSLQTKKLRAIITHSYNNVPYYHSLMKEAEITPDEIRTLDDLHKVPITSKEDLRELALEDITSRNADLKECYVRQTSGTSGIPLSITWDKSARAIHFLAYLRWMMACGIRASNRINQIYETTWLSGNHLIQKLGMYRTKTISHLQSLNEQIDVMKEFRPDALIGFPSGTRLLAEEIRDRDITGVSPGLVFTGGEMLDEHSRRLNKEVFGAETYDHYGCNEAGDISCECEKREGYHNLSDLLLVNVVRDNEAVSPGETGEIVITNLFNYAGPVIRYNLGDIGHMLEDPCSCGKCFPLMKIDEARRGEVVALPDGKRVPFLVFNALLNEIDGVKQYRVIQETLNRFIVEIVANRQFTDATVVEIEEKVKDKMGDVEVGVTLVDHIAFERSGKFRPFISRL
jgi:phenylacetate-CoA ligase